jgi:hypothetical protein
MNFMCCGHGASAMLFQPIFCAPQEKPSDPDIFRLLGELKYELKDYDGSVAAYKTSQMVSLPQVCRIIF